MKFIIFIFTLFPLILSAEIYQYHYSNGAIIYSDRVPNSVMNLGYAEMNKQKKGSTLLDKKSISKMNESRANGTTATNHKIR